MSKYKLGSTIHVWFKSGGGQLYTIVGENKDYLFVSYDIAYPENRDMSCSMKVIAKAEYEAQKKEKL